MQLTYFKDQEYLHMSDFFNAENSDAESATEILPFPHGFKRQTLKCRFGFCHVFFVQKSTTTPILEWILCQTNDMVLSFLNLRCKNTVPQLAMLGFPIQMYGTGISR